MRYLILSMALGVTLIGAALAETPVLKDGHFDVTRLGDELVDGMDPRPELIFDKDGAVAGTGGCNRLMGSYDQQGATLSFGPLASTKMACGEVRDGLEMRFFDALSRTRGVVGSGANVVDLVDADGNVVATLERR